MKPDMRTWVEAAISKHLRDGMPLGQTHAYLVRGILAQLLRYWRYEAPGDLGDLLDNVTYSIIAWQIKERASVSMGERAVDEYAPAALAAVRAGDWKSLAALPDAVWGWVRELTGLTRAEWEMVPETAAEVLCTEFACPRCHTQGPLRDLLKIRQGAEPLQLTSTGAARFICGKCGSGLALDLSEPRIPDTPESLRARRSYAPAIGLLVLAAAIIYLILRYI